MRDGGFTFAIALLAVVMTYMFVLRTPQFVKFANDLLGDIKPGAGAVQ